MNEAVNLDAETVAHFRRAAGQAELQLHQLHTLARGAALPPGTFTHTTAGQIYDRAHAELVEGASDLIDSGREVLRAITSATIAAVEEMLGTDAANAEQFSDLGEGLDRPRREGS